MQSQSMARVYARPDAPCPVCESYHGCSIGSDGLIFCRKKSGTVAGFRYIGAARTDPSWHLYRRENDPVLRGDRAAATPPNTEDRAEGGTTKKAGKRDWPAMARTYTQALTPTLRDQLAGELCLPPFALHSILLIGYKSRDQQGPCWTLPMQNGAGEIIGLQRRWRGGAKADDWASQQGLFVCRDWEERQGPVYVAEGVSDTLALAALGLAALGRHHCTSPHDALAMLIAPYPKREVVVLGDLDYDYRGDRHPGRDGAKACAEALAAALKRQVSWTLPPRGRKDVRDWCSSLSMLPATEEAWAEQARHFTEGLQLHTTGPEEKTNALDSLSTLPFSQVEPEVIDWIVPDFFPLGLPILLAGEGGIGKSHVTLHVAARISQGEPCFGLNYDPGQPRDVLIANCEDSSRKTMLPRLQSAGANLDRVHKIEGVLGAGGKPAPFSLAHLDQIAEKIHRHPEIALVVIDPVSSYVAAAGMDDNNELEVRKLLDPLGDLAESSGVLFVLMKHVRKAGGNKAVHSVIGSGAYTQRTRASYFVFEEPGNEINRLFLCGKINDARKPQGRIFRLEAIPTSEQDAILASLPSDWPAAKRAKYRPALVTTRWYGETDYTADDVTREQGQTEQENSQDVDRAAHWLRRALATTPMRTEDVIEDGNQALESIHAGKWWRDRILKGRLGGSSQKGKAGPHDSWFFCLPGQNVPDAPSE